MFKARKLSIILSLMMALLLSVPVLAAPQTTGLILGQHSTSGQSRYVKSRDCLVTDDWDYRLYTGSMAVGEVFTASWDSCYHEDYYVTFGTDEGALDDLAIQMTGRGLFDVSLTIETRDFIHVLPAHEIDAGKAHYTGWNRCSTYRDRRGLVPYDEFGHVESGGHITLTIKNVGSTIAKDIYLRTETRDDSTTWLSQVCPFREDWGY